MGDGDPRSGAGMDPSMLSASGGNGVDMQAMMSSLGLDPEVAEMAQLCMSVPETCAQCVRSL